MSNVILFDRREPDKVTRIPIKDRDEINRVANQYALNLSSIMRQAYASLGEDLAKTMIDLAHSAALADHKTDKRRV